MPAVFKVIWLSCCSNCIKQIYAITFTNLTSYNLLELNSCGSITQSLPMYTESGVNNLGCFDSYEVTQQKKKKKQSNIVK